MTKRKEKKKRKKKRIIYIYKIIIIFLFGGGVREEIFWQVFTLKNSEFDQFKRRFIWIKKDQNLPDSKHKWIY